MGGWGFILPFINLFYISLGLSGTQIGTIGSVSSIVGLMVSPIIVSEIKKRSQARGILQASLMLGAIGARWLYALATTGYAMGLLSLWITRPEPGPMPVTSKAKRFA